MSRQAVVTVGSILLAATFFSIPLILKYRVYRPYTQTIATGDVVPVSLSGISPLWCQGVELESASSFEAFQFDEAPVVAEGDVVRSAPSLKLQLEKGVQEYWGFHLLRGSRIDVSGCSQLPRAGITVVKGEEELLECLREHRIRQEKEAESEEDSLSDSESDEGTSSISSSQGVVGNDSAHLFECRPALHHSQLEAAYTCGHGLRPNHTLLHEVWETDYYYLVFASSTYLDIVPNQVFLELTIDRTQYDWTGSSGNCSSGEHTCRLPVEMGSAGSVVVATRGSDGTPVQTQDVTVSCRPRESLFLIFYAAFLITIFVCAFH